MTLSITWVGLLCCVCFTGIVRAANLGELTLHSGLGELLNAHIKLTTTSSTELSTLTVAFADRQFALKEGVVLPERMRDMRLELDRSGTEPMVRLSSVRPINEPFLNIIIELSWANGSYLREYTLLIDPVVDEGGSILAIGGVQARNQDPQDINLDEIQYEGDTIEPPLYSALESSAQTLQRFSAGNTIEVASGESLMGIARSLATESTTVDQTMWALYRLNPRAFFGSINQLKAGALLQIPDISEIVRYSESQAKAALQRSEMTPATKPASNVQNNKTVDREEPTETLATDPDLTTPDNAVVTLETLPHTETLNDVRGVVTELRASLRSLSTVLDTRSTQLKAISSRIDQIQQAQAQEVVRQQEPPVPAESVSNTTSPTLSAELEAVETPIATESAIAAAQTTEITTETESDTDELIDQLLKELQPTDDEDTVAINTPPEGDLQSGTGTDTTPSTPSSIAETESESALIPSSGSQETPATVDSPIQKKNSGNLNSWWNDENQHGPVFSKLRDTGLVCLALALIYILVNRLRSASNLSPRSSSFEFEPLDLDDSLAPIAPTFHDSQQPSETLTKSTSQSPAAQPVADNPTDNGQPTGSRQRITEWFETQLSQSERKEHGLKVALEKSPDRQDLRLELLKAYADRKAVRHFSTVARDMYQMTGGKNPEWHDVIQLGLALDTDLQFYPGSANAENANEVDFDLETNRIVNSVPAGTTVEQDDKASRHESSSVTVNLALDLPRAASDPTPQVLNELPKTDSLIEHPAPSSINPEPASVSTNPEQSPITNMDVKDLDIILDLDLLDSGLKSDARPPEPQEKKDTSGSLTQVSATEQVVEDSRSVSQAMTQGETHSNPVKNTALENSDPSADMSVTNNISDWKKIEIKLDLAILQKKLGHHDVARDLFNEVIELGDALQQEVARAMLSKLI